MKNILLETFFYENNAYEYWCESIRGVEDFNYRQKLYVRMKQATALFYQSRLK